MSRIIRLPMIVLVLTCIAPAASGQEQDRPNILWIVSEDNSPLLGCYGDSFATTPHLDKLASEGVRYEHAFAAAPVCAPTRSTLITGMYATSMGTQHMRSTYPVPDLIKFFPRYLREAGYYTTNNAKKDYNTVDQPEAWDESSKTATYTNRAEGQPFFAVFNIAVSHESAIHTPLDRLQHDPEKVPLPPYHPRTPEMKHDWAQYYDKITAMDAQVGALLTQLEEAGLAGNTIVFYYSDHGGVLGRSKRFMYESGLRVPLIIRFPEKYAHLAPARAGSVTDRIVSFVDFAPTVLSLAGVPVPGYMQGAPFLGKQEHPPRRYAYSFRGRMDERPDMVRSVRDKQYRYIRNYMPHKIYGQYIEYLWKAPSMRSWEQAYRDGKLNKVQSVFWEVKPAEELYDVKADPHNINNLAKDSTYKSVMERMRTATQEWIVNSADAGLIPEPMLVKISGETTIYDYARSRLYHPEQILETAEMASSQDTSKLAGIIKRLHSDDAAVRYWAATGCTVLQAEAARAKPDLETLLRDAEPCVRVAAAEALYCLGSKDTAMPVLAAALENDNLMIRVQALNVLENTGADASAVLPALKELLARASEKPDYDTRAAKRLIEKIK